MKISDVIHQEPPSGQAELAEFFKKFPKEAEVFVKKMPAGVFFIKEGEPNTNVYIVLEGTVGPWFRAGYNAFTSGQCGRLTVIGDIAALGRFGYYTTSSYTLTTCRLLEVRVNDYWNWILQDSEALKTQVGNALRTLVNDLKNKRDLEEESAEVRLLSYFVFYCRKEHFGRKGKSGTITVKETRERIAEEVGGISVRTVNRKISQFVEEGLVTVVHGKIQISLEQLRKMKAIVGG